MKENIEIRKMLIKINIMNSFLLILFIKIFIGESIEIQKRLLTLKQF